MHQYPKGPEGKESQLARCIEREADRGPEFGQVGQDFEEEVLPRRVQWADVGLRRSTSVGGLDVLLPVVGARHDLKDGCARTCVADSDDTYLNAEKGDLDVSAFVQPVQRSAKLVAEPWGDPHHCDRIQTRGVHQALAKVGMVGAFELVVCLVID